MDDIHILGAFLERKGVRLYIPSFFYDFTIGSRAIKAKREKTSTGDSETEMCSSRMLFIE